ncbi:MAG: hypothetical protein HQL24_10160 [Candidatus Omnitrophica bacterium]|nr:hypothetical protein [Candidatus Omnitrophota bacterium]
MVTNLSDAQVQDFARQADADRLKNVSADFTIPPESDSAMMARHWGGFLKTALIMTTGAVMFFSAPKATLAQNYTPLNPKATVTAIAPVKKATITPQAVQPTQQAKKASVDNSKKPVEAVDLLFKQLPSDVQKCLLQSGWSADNNIDGKLFKQHGYELIGGNVIIPIQGLLASHGKEVLRGKPVGSNRDIIFVDANSFEKTVKEEKRKDDRETNILVGGLLSVSALLSSVLAANALNGWWQKRDERRKKSIIKSLLNPNLKIKDVTFYPNGDLSVKTSKDAFILLRPGYNDIDFHKIDKNGYPLPRQDLRGLDLDGVMENIINVAAKKLLNEEQQKLLKRLTKETMTYHKNYLASVFLKIIYEKKINDISLNDLLIKIIDENLFADDSEIFQEIVEEVANNSNIYQSSPQLKVYRTLLAGNDFSDIYSLMAHFGASGQQFFKTFVAEGVKSKNKKIRATLRKVISAFAENEGVGEAMPLLARSYKQASLEDKPFWNEAIVDYLVESTGGQGIKYVISSFMPQLAVYTKTIEKIFSDEEGMNLTPLIRIFFNGNLNKFFIQYPDLTAEQLVIEFLKDAGIRKEAKEALIEKNISNFIEYPEILKTIKADPSLSQYFLNKLNEGKFLNSSENFQKRFKTLLEVFNPEISAFFDNIVTAFSHLGYPIALVAPVLNGEFNDYWKQGKDDWLLFSKLLINGGLKAEYFNIREQSPVDRVKLLGLFLSFPEDMDDKKMKSDLIWRINSVNDNIVLGATGDPYWEVGMKAVMASNGWIPEGEDIDLLGIVSAIGEGNTEVLFSNLETSPKNHRDEIKNNFKNFADFVKSHPQEAKKVFDFLRETGINSFFRGLFLFMATGTNIENGQALYDQIMNPNENTAAFRTFCAEHGKAVGMIFNALLKFKNNQNSEEVDRVVDDIITGAIKDLPAIFPQIPSLLMDGYKKIKGRFDPAIFDSIASFYEEQDNDSWNILPKQFPDDSRVHRNEGKRVSITELLVIKEEDIQMLPRQGRTIRFKVAGREGVYHFKYVVEGKDAEELNREARILDAIQKGIITVPEDVKKDIPQVITPANNDGSYLLAIMKHQNEPLFFDISFRTGLTGILYHAPEDYFTYITANLEALDRINKARARQAYQKKYHAKGTKLLAVENGLLKNMETIVALWHSGILRQEHISHRWGAFRWMSFYQADRLVGSMNLKMIHSWLEYPNIATTGARDFGHYDLLNGNIGSDEIINALGNYFIYYLMVGAAAFYNNNLGKDHFEKFVDEKLSAVLPSGVFNKAVAENFWQLAEDTYGSYTLHNFHDEEAIGTRGLMMRPGTVDAIAEMSLRVFMDMTAGASVHKSLSGSADKAMLTEQRLIKKYRKDMTISQLERLEKRIVLSEAKMIGNKGEGRFLAGHLKNVSKLAEKLAQISDLSEEEVRMMRILGLIHDLGKVRDKETRALFYGNKPREAFTPREREFYRNHTIYAFRMLEKNGIKIPLIMKALLLGLNNMSSVALAKKITNIPSQNLRKMDSLLYLADVFYGRTETRGRNYPRYNLLTIDGIPEWISSLDLRGLLASGIDKNKIILALQDQMPRSSKESPDQAMTADQTSSSEEMTPTVTAEGRNGDELDLITSAEFVRRTGLDLRQGEHTIVDVGVGYPPVTTIETDKVLAGLNSKIKFIGTELRQATARAEVVVRKGRIFEELKKKIEEYFREDVLLRMPIKEIRFVITDAGDSAYGHVSQVDIKLLDVNQKFLYLAAAVAPNIQYLVGKKINQFDEKRSKLFLGFLDSLGVSDIEGFIRHLNTSNKSSVGFQYKEGKGFLPAFLDASADIIVEKNPVKNALEKQGIQFVETDNLLKSHIEGLSLITVNNVLRHLRDEDREEFFKMAGGALKEHGVLVVKNS